MEEPAYKRYSGAESECSEELSAVRDNSFKDCLHLWYCHSRRKSAH